MRLLPALSLVFLLAPPAHTQALALRDITVSTSPQAPPQIHTTLLIRNGRIAPLAPHANVPAGPPILACTGCVVFAGF